MGGTRAHRIFCGLVGGCALAGVMRVAIAPAPDVGLGPQVAHGDGWNGLAGTTGGRNSAVEEAGAWRSPAAGALWTSRSPSRSGESEASGEDEPGRLAMVEPAVAADAHESIIRSGWARRCLARWMSEALENAQRDLPADALDEREVRLANEAALRELLESIQWPSQWPDTPSGEAVEGESRAAWQEQAMREAAVEALRSALQRQRKREAQVPRSTVRRDDGDNGEARRAPANALEEAMAKQRESARLREQVLGWLRQLPGELGAISILMGIGLLLFAIVYGWGRRAGR